MLICDVDRESIVENMGVCKDHSARILCQMGKLRAVISEGSTRTCSRCASYPTCSGPCGFFSNHIAELTV